MAMTAIDDLLLKLIETGRQASAEEVAAIIAHVVQAPFATYLSRVPSNLRQLLAQKGISVPVRLSSLERHLFKRIYDEQQWPIGTTADGYIRDLPFLSFPLLTLRNASNGIVTVGKLKSSIKFSNLVARLKRLNLKRPNGYSP